MGVLCKQVGVEDCRHLDAQSPQGVIDLSPVKASQFHHLAQYYFSQDIDELGKDGTLTPFDRNLYTKIETIIANTTSQRKMQDAQDCCVLVLDQQGAVVSMNQCRAWENAEAGQVNGCLSQRQVGSTMKPFLYVYATQKLGLTMEDAIVDEKVEYLLDEQHTYAPKNFDLLYHGAVSLAEALGNSLNIPAIKLLDQAGIPGYIHFISELRRKVGHNEVDIETDASKFSSEKL